MRDLPLKRRLLALAGLAAIVGAAVSVLFAADLLGNQAGGEGIEPVELVQTPPIAGAALDVGPEAGKLAPDFVISDFDGTRHRLSDYRGQVVYVNFWATWCVPCQLELPDIQTLEREYAGDLVVITVNRREPLGRAETFLERLPTREGPDGVSFTANGMDPDDALYAEYRALGMPSSFFIDPYGRMTKVFNGLLTLEGMRGLVIEALQAAEPGAGGG